MSNQKGSQASLFSFGFAKKSSQPEPTTSSAPMATPAIKALFKTPSIKVNVQMERATASTNDSSVVGEPTIIKTEM